MTSLFSAQLPTLTTEHLVLGPADMADVDAFGAFCKTDRSVWFGGPTDDPRDAWDSCAQGMGQWLIRGYGAFFARLRSDDAPVGRFALRHPIDLQEPELSYVVYDSYEGRGFATEAALAVREFARDTLGLPPLMSLIARANTRSIALAERLGCTNERVFETGENAVDLWRHPA